MNILVLGSGVCSNGIPKLEDRQPPGFYVSWNGGSILFDCSEGMRFRLEQAGIDYASVKHIAITHTHPDHCALAPYIQAVFCKSIWGGEQFKQEQLTIYGSTYLQKNFWDYFYFHFEEMEKRDTYPWPTISLVDMEVHKEQQIGQATLRSYQLYHGHGKVSALGFRLKLDGKIFAYTGDTGECDALYDLAKDADVLVIDSSARIDDSENAANYGHLNPCQAAYVAATSNVKTLVLTHYTGLDSDNKMRSAAKKIFSGEIIIAKDGMNIDILSA